MNKPEPDISPLLPDDAALKARRAALIDALAAPKTTTASSAWQRVPRLALGGAVAGVAVAVALIVSAGGDNTSTAFAVVPQEGGGVNIVIRSLSDPEGLESALEQAGIRSQVTYLEPGTTCREPHFKPIDLMIPNANPNKPRRLYALPGFGMAGPSALTIGIGDEQRRRRLNREFRSGELRDLPPTEQAQRIPNVFLNPAWFRPDQSLVLWGSPIPFKGDPTGGSAARLQFAEGKVAPCEPIPAANGFPFSRE